MCHDVLVFDVCGLNFFRLEIDKIEPLCHDVALIMDTGENFLHKFPSTLFIPVQTYYYIYLMSPFYKPQSPTSYKFNFPVQPCLFLVKNFYTVMSSTSFHIQWHFSFHGFLLFSLLLTLPSLCVVQLYCEFFLMAKTLFTLNFNRIELDYLLKRL